MKDPFEPKSAKPKDGGDFYVINGQQYPRVTTILASAPGAHLMPWYAKEASLLCASLAYYATGDEPDDAAVLEHRAKRAPYAVSKDDALGQLKNWASNMREAERYRDYRAWIGSTMHHAIYEYVLGLSIPDTDMIEYLTGAAEKLALVPEQALERFNSLGVDIYRNIAFDAKPYFEAVRWFVDAVEPVFLMNGLETCVYCPDEMYAGTADMVIEIDRGKWTRAGYGDLPVDKIAALGDWKSSKSISKSVGYQMAAYAKAPLIHLMQTGEDLPMPEVDALIALHVTPSNAERPVDAHLWGAWGNPNPIEAHFEAFINLNAFYRSNSGLPRAERSRAAKPKVEPKPKVGARTCPI